MKPLPSCTHPIAAVFSVDGTYSPWLLQLQPDNDQSDRGSKAEDYEYCATLALYRAPPTATQYRALGLLDRRCAEEQYFACELPAGKSISVWSGDVTSCVAADSECSRTLY